MNKKQGMLIGIALALLFVVIAIATSTAYSGVVIYAFDQNPAGYDSGTEWVLTPDFVVNLLVAIGTLSMALVIFYLEILKRVEPCSNTKIMH